MSKYKAIGTIGTMFGDVPRYFHNSYKKMMAYNNRYLVSENQYIHEVDASVSWHEMGRNSMVQDARGEWLLMLDTDHSFAPDMLDRLLYYKKKHNCPVISGMYQYKFPPHAPVCNVWTNNGLAPIVSWPKDAEVLQVGTVGAGCLLVDRSVYRKITEETGNNPFDIIAGLSEDYSFCLRCKDLNIPIFLAPKVQCHHMITHTLSTDDYVPTEDCVNVKVEDGKVEGLSV